MKTLNAILLTAVATSGLFVIFGIFLWKNASPLRFLFLTTNISRVEITSRPLKSVVENILNQVEAQDRKKRQINVIFSPEILGHKVREVSGGVFGNPPIEGKADHALYLVAADYSCRYTYVNETTILFYELNSN